MERENTFIDKGFTQTGSLLEKSTEIVGSMAGKLYEKVQPALEVYKEHILSRIFSRKIRTNYGRRLRFT